MSSTSDAKTIIPTFVSHCPPEERKTVDIESSNSVDSHVCKTQVYGNECNLTEANRHTHEQSDEATNENEHICATSEVNVTCNSDIDNVTSCQSKQTLWFAHIPIEENSDVVTDVCSYAHNNIDSSENTRPTCGKRGETAGNNNSHNLSEMVTFDQDSSTNCAQDGEIAVLQEIYRRVSLDESSNEEESVTSKFIIKATKSFGEIQEFNEDNYIERFLTRFTDPEGASREEITRLNTQVRKIAKVLVKDNLLTLDNFGDFARGARREGVDDEFICKIHEKTFSDIVKDIKFRNSTNMSVDPLNEGAGIVEDDSSRSTDDDSISLKSFGPIEDYEDSATIKKYLQKYSHEVFKDTEPVGETIKTVKKLNSVIMRSVELEKCSNPSILDLFNILDDARRDGIAPAIIHGLYKEHKALLPPENDVDTSTLISEIDEDRIITSRMSFGSIEDDDLEDEIRSYLKRVDENHTKDVPPVGVTEEMLQTLKNQVFKLSEFNNRPDASIEDVSELIQEALATKVPIASLRECMECVNVLNAIPRLESSDSESEMLLKKSFTFGDIEYDDLDNDIKKYLIRAHDDHTKNIPPVGVTKEVLKSINAQVFKLSEFNKKVDASIVDVSELIQEALATKVPISLLRECMECVNVLNAIPRLKSCDSENEILLKKSFTFGDIEYEDLDNDIKKYLKRVDEDHTKDVPPVGVTEEMLQTINAQVSKMFEFERNTDASIEDVSELIQEAISTKISIPLLRECIDSFNVLNIKSASRYSSSEDEADDKIISSRTSFEDIEDCDLEDDIKGYLSRVYNDLTHDVPPVGATREALSRLNEAISHLDRFHMNPDASLEEIGQMIQDAMSTDCPVHVIQESCGNFRALNSRRISEDPSEEDDGICEDIVARFSAFESIESFDNDDAIERFIVKCSPPVGATKDEIEALNALMQSVIPIAEKETASFEELAAMIRLAREKGIPAEVMILIYKETFDVVRKDLKGSSHVLVRTKSNSFDEEEDVMPCIDQLGDTIQDNVRPTTFTEDVDKAVIKVVGRVVTTCNGASKLVAERSISFCSSMEEFTVSSLKWFENYVATSKCVENMPCTQRRDEVAIPTSINLSNSTSVDVADSNYAKSNDAKAELAKCVSDQTFETIGTRKSSDKNSDNMTSNSMLFDVESKVVPKKEEHETHRDPSSGIVRNLHQEVAGLTEMSIHQDVADGPLAEIENVIDSNYAESNDAKADLAKCVNDQTFETLGTSTSSDKNSDNTTSNSVLFDVESKVVPKKEDHETHCDPGSGIVRNLDQDVAGLNERSIHQDVTDGPLADIENELNFQILASIVSSDHPVSPKNPISTVSELSRNFSNKSKEVEFQVHDEKSPMSVGSTVKLDECFLSHNEYGSVIPSEASVNNSKGSSVDNEGDANFDNLSTDDSRSEMKTSCTDTSSVEESREQSGNLSDGNEILFLPEISSTHTLEEDNNTDDEIGMCLNMHPHVFGKESNLCIPNNDTLKSYDYCDDKLVQMDTEDDTFIYDTENKHSLECDNLVNATTEKDNGNPIVHFTSNDTVGKEAYSCNVAFFGGLNSYGIEIMPKPKSTLLKMHKSAKKRFLSCRQWKKPYGERVKEHQKLPLSDFGIMCKSVVCQSRRSVFDEKRWKERNVSQYFLPTEELNKYFGNFVKCSLNDAACPVRVEAESPGISHLIKMGLNEHKWNEEWYQKWKKPSKMTMPIVGDLYPSYKMKGVPHEIEKCFSYETYYTENSAAISNVMTIETLSEVTSVPESSSKGTIDGHNEDMSETSLLVDDIYEDSDDISHSQMSSELSLMENMDDTWNDDVRYFINESVIDIKRLPYAMKELMQTGRLSDDILECLHDDDDLSDSTSIESNDGSDLWFQNTGEPVFIKFEPNYPGGNSLSSLQVLETRTCNDVINKRCVGEIKNFAFVDGERVSRVNPSVTSSLWKSTWRKQHFNSLPH